MRQVNTLLLVSMMVVMASTLNGQATFTDKTSLLQNPATFTSGVAIAVADMNADGLDDIVRLDKGKSLSIEYQVPNGQPFTNFTYGDLFPGGNQTRAWAIVVGDANNDGYCDILSGGSYTGVKMLTAINSGTDFDLQTFPGSNIFMQGSNMADINNDGWLDVFACHDDGPSRIWLNDATGLFPAEANNAVINFDITPGTIEPFDDSGNYGSVWTDFDNDGDLDLYIAKCRIGVFDMEDTRRINVLFVNDGQNNYTEAGEEYGLRIHHQSWTADFQDIDNDGDMDCFVTNHDFRVQLLENDGTGHFTDITEQAGIIMGSNFEYNEGLMRDFDNDGFVDIITAQPVYFFHNNGDKTFTQVSNLFPSSFGTLAVGDLNHDGFQDIYSAYQNSYNTPTSIPDKLWMNDGNDNHFLAVQLKGVQSNRTGVGARIELHGSWGIQIREVRAGESYGISNSLTAYFGLGQETEVEYAVVRWPSGTVDVVPNPASDQYITIEEGSSCALGSVDITYDGPSELCPGQSVSMMAPAGYEYLWNNGAVSQTATVDHPGNYSVVVVDASGCVGISSVLSIATAEIATPAIAAVGETEFCEGGSVELAASGASGYTWSNGVSGPVISVGQTGDYFVTVPSVCGDVSTAPIHVEVLPMADVPQADDVTIFGPGTATLMATGNMPHWYDSPDGMDILAIGNSFETPTLTETTSYYVQDVNEYGGGDFEVGMVNHQGTLYSGNNTNGQLIFDVFDDFILKTVKVTTEFPGIRTIELRNNNGTVLQSVEMDIPMGISILDIGFTIGPGTGYILTTNEARNMETFNVQGPRLVRSNEGVEYPYAAPDIVSINTSSQGTGYYYYFFDWQIEAVPTSCPGDRVPVTVNVEPNAVFEGQPFGKISVQPNPSSGLFQLYLEALESGRATLSVLDLTGRQVYQEQFEVTGGLAQIRRIDLANLASGMYLLKVASGESVVSLKLAVD
ncbi:MAG: VCBS repeat-containing protein [Lewinellaceae bacterium]|nr:VCBS repeat-containing protein [Saprospiraceae bacterium]MCB9336715.1 VCBS repeat-containing protein [Lewinellaceae bacterium]